MDKKSKRTRITKKAFSRIFGTELEAGMFVKYWKGKVLWRVVRKYQEYSFLTSANQSWGSRKLLFEKDYGRVYEIPVTEAFLYLLRVYPGGITKWLTPETLEELADRIRFKEPE